MQRRLVAGVVLAAGLAERFGGGKLLYRIRGKPLLHYCLEACIPSRLHEIVVVVGPGDVIKANVQNHFTDERIRFARNDNPRRGQTSSLKIGLASVDASCDAAMVFLGDMPFVTTGIISLLLDRYDRRGGIVIPVHGSRAGHPRVLPRALFPQFVALEDHEKGLAVIERHRARVSRVQVDDPRFLIDIDEVQDLDTMDE